MELRADTRKRGCGWVSRMGTCKDDICSFFLQSASIIDPEETRYGIAVAIYDGWEIRGIRSVKG